jgi:hypothetical protein
MARAALETYVLDAAGRGELELPDQWHFEDFSARIKTERFSIDDEPPISICWVTGTAVAGPGTGQLDDEQVQHSGDPQRLVDDPAVGTAQHQ